MQATKKSTEKDEQGKEIRKAAMEAMKKRDGDREGDSSFLAMALYCI